MAIWWEPRCSCTLGVERSLVISVAVVRCWRTVVDMGVSADEVVVSCALFVDMMGACTIVLNVPLMCVKCV